MAKTGGLLPTLPGARNMQSILNGAKSRQLMGKLRRLSDSMARSRHLKVWQGTFKFNPTNNFICRMSHALWTSADNVYAFENVQDKANCLHIVAADQTVKTYYYGNHGYRGTAGHRDGGSAGNTPGDRRAAPAS
jgi:hypothetical protein